MINNNLNVREAIVRPKRDKNINPITIALVTTQRALKGLFTAYEKRIDSDIISLGNRKSGAA